MIDTFQQIWLQEHWDDLIFFIAIHFWYIFLFLAIIFLFLSIKLLRDKAKLQYTLDHQNRALSLLANTTKMVEIEEFILNTKHLLKAHSVGLYIARGDIYLLESKEDFEGVALPLRIYKKEIEKEKKIGQFFYYYIESFHEKVLLLLVSKQRIDIDKEQGFFQISLAYYECMREAGLGHRSENVTNASKEVLANIMKLQYGTETFIKFIISLLIKTSQATGVILYNKELPKKASLFLNPKKGRYKKLFYIRNTPFALEIYTLEPLTKEKIEEIGSFLDLAGSYFENIDANSKMITNYIRFLRLANQAIELQSRFFKNHSQKVKIASVEIAKNLFLDEDAIDLIALGAEFHDIGMIGKIEGFLDSKKIDKKELDLIKYHPIVGSVIVEPISNAYNIVPIIRYHHERYDGSGYPYALKGKDIPLFAQIVALAEYYVGITSDRAYRRGISHEEAVEDIAQQKNRLVEENVIYAFLDAQKSIQKKIELLQTK